MNLYLVRDDVLQPWEQKDDARWLGCRHEVIHLVDDLLWDQYYETHTAVNVSSKIHQNVVERVSWDKDLATSKYQIYIVQTKQLRNQFICMQSTGFLSKNSVKLLRSWKFEYQVSSTDFRYFLGISDSQGLPYTANVVNKKSGAYIQNALNRATMGLSLKAKRFYRIGPWRLGSSYSNFWPVAMCQREFRIATFKRRTRDTLCSLL